MLHKTLFILFITAGFQAFSQSPERSFFGGIMYKSSGIGLAFQRKSDTKNSYGKQLDLELTSYHHNQETKTFNSELNNPSPFVFGKLNKAALLKLNYGRCYKISQFTDAQRIGVDVSLSGGLIVGFLTGLS